MSLALCGHREHVGNGDCHGGKLGSTRSCRIRLLQTPARIAKCLSATIQTVIIIIIMAGMAVFYVARYLIEERRRWPVIRPTSTTVLPHEDNVLNKFRILKERHVRMRKPYQSPGQDEKLILLYCPGRGLNSRPPAHRSFEHGQGVPRPNHSATEAVDPKS